jgi:hypothetical protein
MSDLTNDAPHDDAELHGLRLSDFNDLDLGVTADYLFGFAQRWIDRGGNLAIAECLIHFGKACLTEVAARHDGKKPAGVVYPHVLTNAPRDELHLAFQTLARAASETAALDLGKGAVLNADDLAALLRMATSPFTVELNNRRLAEAGADN